EIVKADIRAVIVKVAGIPVKFLGKEINDTVIKELEKLKSYANISGEGGEFETLVIDAPNFRQQIKIIQERKTVENEVSGLLVVRAQNR
ncbi:MAG: hypothetical protein J7L14_02245, partial [Candidatus Diapherotrites archaeon]|nr:hypothetical protein [Candidatus Diapherotrites archaeon]